MERRKIMWYNTKMRIVIAAPFYPPDTEDMAVYAKELAENLAKRHDVSVVTYARLPEESSGVRIYSVNKRLPLIFRLARFTATLFCAVRKADILYAENGASVEVPSALVALTTRRPFIIHFDDKTAIARSSKNLFLKMAQRFAQKRAISEVSDIPRRPPEILPFGLPPEKELVEYRASWENHMQKLTDIFNETK